MMKKRYIFGALVALIVIFFVSSILFGAKDEPNPVQNSMMPRIGQKLWTYNMNKHQWREYSNNDDDESKEEIILQVQQVEDNGGYTSYKLLTGNAQVPKEDVWVGEGSQEFLRGKTLYTYFPKNFMFFEVVFNGVKFITKSLSEDELKSVMKGCEIIKVSELKKGTLKLPFNRNKNRFVIINDIGEDFYKYYIVPNDSTKLQIGEFSNEFVISDKVDVQLQRIEGCSKAYPCYNISYF